MKIFACQRQYSHSGGVVVVTARNLDEAFRTFVKWDMDNMLELHTGFDMRTGKPCFTYRNYPREKWYEIPGINTDAKEPMVIDEGGYNE